VPQQETMTFGLEVANIEEKNENEDVISDKFQPLKQDNNNNRIKRIRLSHGSKEQQENTLSTLAEQAFEIHVVDMPIYNCLVCNHTLKKKICSKQQTNIYTET
jgi:rubrerythrin